MFNINDHDSVFDIRDLIERVEHLEQLRQPGPVDLGEDDNEQAQDDLFAELKALEEFLGEVRGNGGDEQWRGDWYPVTFIADSHFEDYAQELADDIGAINRDASWPNNCIDWERAARELQADYRPVDLDGETYWYR